MKFKTIGFISSTLYYIPAVFAADYDYKVKSVANKQFIFNTGENLYINIGEASKKIEHDNQNIQPWGKANDTIINDGDIQNVDGGSVSNTTINDGGTQNVNGGSVSNTTINDGGTQNVNGGFVSNTTIKDGGYQIVNDGFVTNTTNNGSLEVFGGTVTNTVSNGGYIDVAGPSTIFKNTIVNNRGYLTTIEVNVTGITLNSSRHYVNWGSSVTDTIINDGGHQYTSDSNITLTNTTINHGGLQTINGGHSLNTTINEGGTLNLNKGVVENVEVSGQNARFLIKAPEAGSWSFPTIAGSVTISDGGQIVLGYGASSHQADMTLNNGGSLLLNNEKECTTDCQYELNNLTMSGGSVMLYNTQEGVPTGWNTLTLTDQFGDSSLSGYGDFYMHTDIAASKGDLLHVIGNATGSFRLFVQDTGVSPTLDNSLVLVKTGGGDAVFTLGNQGGVVELGTWEYRLIKNDTEGWLLSPDLKP
ncbi:autotransporter outer membrane beta-barrel domain-containing protein, partial [Citrobacter sp. wls621]